MADTAQIQKLIRNLQGMVRNEKATRDIVESVHAVVSERIFNEGGTKDINNISLGNYTPAYLKRRIKKGRGTSPKIRLQWSQTFKEGFQVIALPSNPGKFRFGSGWMNIKLGDLSEWLEDKYNKKDKIFALSEEEEKLFYNLNEKYIQRNLNA